MIFTEGNILDADVEALVNPVNCVGVMGAGLALQFKRKFPANFTHYKLACKYEEVYLGSVLLHYNIRHPKWIINFPTKYHWKDKSSILSIQLGLNDLVRTIEKHQIQSIAIPKLGCGLGGLDWEVVKPLLIDALDDVKIDCRIFL